MTAVDTTTPTSCACPTVEVRVQGELDLATVARLRERLDDALSLRPRRLYVDLQDCPFFDACGITLLLDVHRAAWRQGTTLVLQGCGHRHRRILALTGLLDVFELSDDGPSSCH